MKILIVAWVLGAILIAYIFLRRPRRSDGDDPIAAGVPTAAAGPQPVIGIADWGGVFLQATADELVLVLLPQRDPAAIDRVATAPERGRIARMIVVNDPAIGGHLWGSVVRERLHVEPGKVHATVATEGIDRTPEPAADERVRKANPLPDRVRLGALTIRPAGPNAVHASYPGGPTILVGAAIDFATLAATPVLRVIGSLAFPAGAPPSVDALVQLSQGGVMLLGGVPPGADERAARALAAMGVEVRVVEASPPLPDWALPARALVEPALAEDVAALDAALDAADDKAIEMAMISLVLRPQLDAAQRIGERAIERRGARPAIHHQLGVIATMRDELPAAERHLRAAAEADPPYAPSLVNLALVLARADGDAARLGEARALADRAVALMPEDRVANEAALVLRLRSGDVDGARAWLAEPRPAIPWDRRAILEALVAQVARGEPFRVFDSFPMHADLATELAQPLLDAQRWDEALPLVRRAVELDQGNLGRIADLGFVLGKLDRDDEAIALYDAAIDRIPEGALLRINRGNARRRTGDLGGAIADYRHLVELAPTLVEPRIGLVAALADAGRRDEAKLALADLVAQGGAPAEVIDALTTQLR